MKPAASRNSLRAYDNQRHASLNMRLLLVLE
jgi:hypothetical protein